MLSTAGSSWNSLRKRFLMAPILRSPQQGLELLPPMIFERWRPLLMGSRLSVIGGGAPQDSRSFWLVNGLIVRKFLQEQPVPCPLVRTLKPGRYLIVVDPPKSKGVEQTGLN